VRLFATLPRPGRRPTLDRGKIERRLAFALAICAIVAGLVTYALTSGAPPYAAGVTTILVLLNLDLILLLLLAAVIARRLIRLWLERRQGSAGSRLHMRLVAVFGLLATAPAVIVSIFSVVFLSAGLEQWFSSRINAALQNSLEVAQAYLEEHREVIRADALAMAADLEREGPQLFENPAYLRHFVVAQAALRSLTEAIVFDREGRVLAHSGLGLALEVEQLPRAVLNRAEAGEVVTLTSETEDRIRAVLRLNTVGDVFLFVGRFVDPQVLGFMGRTQQIASEYQQLQSERSGIQITSALIFGIVALLLLLAAIWVGLNFADRLATPISRLIAAADRVRQGDLGARVPEPGSEDEVDLLIRAFNRMTDQLEAQRGQLVMTNQQLDERRRFTEAVLGGVSAGVIGLDAERRVLLPNRSAVEMFGSEGALRTDTPVESILPEIGGLFEALEAEPSDSVQQQIIVHRDADDRILLVRLVAQMEDGKAAGYVVTFDDVTELITAQRQAAWAEVARRIAHEIKNPLTPIRLSAERLSRRFLGQIAPEDQDGFQRSIGTIVRQVDTIGRLVSEFSAFARMPSLRIRFEPLVDILKNAVLLQQGAWPGVSFVLDLPQDDALVVPCDAEKLGQVITNLLQNAMNALSEREEGTADGVIRISAGRAKDGVCVEIADNGPGFPSHDRERLFEPYFTTRAKGTGLGLAIVRKIMEEHKGRVDLENGNGGGAVVRLWFPVGASDARATAEDDEMPRASDAQRSPERPMLTIR
jgi:two-component system nitrogen regulation sensor histidine kinase NtrY